MKKNSLHRRSGFTLVEVLVVVTIITILAALITPAVFNAISAAEEGRIMVELNQLSGAMQQYKNLYGAFPPNVYFSPNSSISVQKHLSRAFPRFQGLPNPPIVQRFIDIKTGLPLLAANGSPRSVNLVQLDSAEAIVFWLSGFSKDPTNPISGQGERSPLFSFDFERLTDRDNDGLYEYVPKGGKNVPYVYFPNKSYSILPTSFYVDTTTSAGTAAPYQTSTLTSAQQQQVLNAAKQGGSTAALFANAKSFQIISAGLDGLYSSASAGTPRFFPSGIGFTPEDRDNLTNFSDGALENSME